MDGHTWVKTAESAVMATGARTRTQVMWYCPRCQNWTLVDSGKDPEATKELYSMEPLELDGTTIMEPPIQSCDIEIVAAVMKS